MGHRLVHSNDGAMGYSCNGDASTPWQQGCCGHGSGKGVAVAVVRVATTVRVLVLQPPRW